MKFDGRHTLGIFSIIILLMISVSAVTEEYYQLNTNSTLEFRCTLNNAVPSGSATYNYSITHVKTGEKLVVNKQANALGQGTFQAFTTFNQSGTYSIKQYCYDTVYNFSNTDDVFVNYYGEPVSLQQTIIYAISILFLGALLFIFLAIANALPRGDSQNDFGEIVQINQMKHFRPILYTFSYAVLVGIVFILSNISLAYLNNLLLGNFMFMMFRLMFWAGIIALPLAFVWLFYRMYQDGIKKKLLDRGVGVGGTQW